jgi:hypothetical protein
MNSRGSQRKSTVPDGVGQYGIFRNAAFAHRMMAAIVLVMVLTSMILGERVAVNGGLGWDGVTYAALVRNIGNVNFSNSLGTYYAQRILPSFVVRQALLLFNSTLNDQNIITAFAIMNGLICVALVDVWRRICDVLDLSIVGRWVGFTGLFINFEMSKQSMFYPVLTDPMALILSALLLLFYLKRKLLAILIVSGIGAFCWPTLAVTGAILCFFMPKSSYVPAPSAALVEQAKPEFRRFYWLLASTTLLMIFLTLPIAHSACVEGLGTFDIFGYLPNNIANKFRNSESLKDPCLLAQQAFTAVPSFMLLAFGMVILIWPLLGKLSLIDIFTRQRMACAAVAVAIMVLAWGGIKLISSAIVSNPSSILLLVRLMILPPVGKIFLPLVSLGAFWGPCLIYVVVAWSRISEEARNLGIGIVAVLCFSLPFGLVGEPRFLTTVWPILVTLTAVVLGRPHPGRIYGALILGSLLLAQFWLPINIVPWPPGVFANLEEFPKQLFFMHYGLWMGWIGYGVQAVILAAVGWLLYQSSASDQKSEAVPGD